MTHPRGKLADPGEGYLDTVWSTLSEMIEEVHACNVQHGWYEKERTFGDDTALLHTEISEMFEAFREIGTEKRTRPKKDGEPIGKPDDVGSEAADILIRLLDTCYRYGIDLDEEFNRKMRFNWTRPHRHGGKQV